MRVQDVSAVLQTRIYQKHGKSGVLARFVLLLSVIRMTRENYIAGRYHSPVIKQFLSPVNPETVLADALSAYGLNLYSLCLTNPVNLAYNEYTIEPGVELTYTPPALSAWDLFWRRPMPGKNNTNHGLTAYF